MVIFHSYVSLPEGNFHCLHLGIKVMKHCFLLVEVWVTQSFLLHLFGSGTSLLNLLPCRQEFHTSKRHGPVTQGGWAIGFWVRSKHVFLPTVPCIKNHEISDFHRSLSDFRHWDFLGLSNPWIVVFWWKIPIIFPFWWKFPYIFLHRCRTLSFSGDPLRSYQDAAAGWERKPAAEDQLCGTVTGWRMGCGELLLRG